MNIFNNNKIIFIKNIIYYIYFLYIYYNYIY